MGISWSREDLPGPVGPYISPNYVPEMINKGDFAAATAVWALTVVWGGICAWQGYKQTKQARNPWKSAYIWLIWLELLVSLLMGAECWAFMLRLLHPSFAFYMTILFWWCIQVQLLLQVIINRVRVISMNKEKARNIMIGTAVLVTLINISVFNIWIPARLQINDTYIHINEIWDRIEKVIYLIMDAVLNAYFIKSVRKNLVSNGLQKYSSLLKFNVRIIFISLLMDVMIIAAMSIPNSFVYIQFHPLAYLVKLNIELTMASLIRKIAISAAAKRGNAAGVHHEFVYANGSSGKGTQHTAMELSSGHGRSDSRFEFEGEGIQKTQEVVIRSMPNPDMKGAIHDVDQLSNSSTKDEGGSTTGADADDESQLVQDPWTGNAVYKTKISTTNQHH
ncbi:hypothetical protein BFW01_g9414 [Lasiodiplodia theobromae]|uniref:Transmembrane protein n=2 Tax=Lasiodiplodia TaxID=66739 RepID=A0A5N5DK33_9PEZI|nr:uncharacterized protein LTHEOB_11186 [Lasiodiplodia theobromae]KAB2577950.1 hypothetical protein DBV05_g3453 [Lasiodiplodia theobromae]KAF4538061.1 hypothetical protein LTHEOB_11186 [Lasiodiplodia theobromae]KAF9638517.1 hypothetical protein BFW01_g9414 [Lasiodiplodia theobromae]KAK0658332.1 hypothetical protein DIS24_g4684 [Lasiodiplodia hormozganensis]